MNRKGRAGGQPPPARNTATRGSNLPAVSSPLRATVSGFQGGLSQSGIKTPPTATDTPKWRAVSPLPPHGIKLPKSKQENLSADSLRGQFRDFLRSQSEQLEQKILVIDFMQLVGHSKELAAVVCNEEASWIDKWLTPAGNEFAEGAKIQLIGFPKRMFPAKDLLNSQHKLTRMRPLFKDDKRVDINVATFRGRMLLRSIILAVLERISMGDSWLGKLDIEDFIFIEERGQLRAIITKEALVKCNASSQDKALDVKGIWPMVEAFFLNSDGGLPLYFEQLKTDLMSATATQMLEAWFVEYLKFHPALASAMARRHLVTGLHSAIEAYDLDRHGEFKRVLDAEPLGGDWRPAALGSKYLRKTYLYRQIQKKGKVVFENPLEAVVYMPMKPKEQEDGKPQDQKEGQNEDEREQRIFANPEQVVVHVQIKPEEAEEELLDMDGDFENTSGGLLKLKRHSVTHTHEHIKTNQQDLDEIEIIGAFTFEDFLPFLLKELLKVGIRRHSAFEGVWSNYQASMGDQKD